MAENTGNHILVSIITVCYNSEATINDTIKGVIAQTYPYWEHIVVDGGSTDRTVEIVKSYEKDYDGRLRLHQGPDKGIYDAMNKGISYAKGKIIGIINSDDWYAPDALENIVSSYLSCPDEEKVITGALNRVRGDVIIYSQKHTKIDLAGLKKGMPLQHPAVFVSKPVYDRIGGFDLSYPHVADSDFIWRCFADGKIKFLFVESVVSYMREGGASDCLSWKHIKGRTIERYHLRAKYLSKTESFYLATKFFVKEYLFQITKKLIGTKNIKRVYTIKHKIRKKE